MICKNCNYSTNRFMVLADGFYRKYKTRMDECCFMVVSIQNIISEVGAGNAAKFHAKNTALRCPKCGVFNAVTKH